MAHQLKSTLASLPEQLKLPRYSNKIQLPDPAIYYEKTGNLQSKHPKAIIGVALLIFLLFWKDIITSSVSHVAARPKAIIPRPENPILNSTLGFQDIFVLSLPERGDRREPLLAGARATNLSITVIDGIKDRQIPDSSKPKWWGTNGWVAKEGELGCLMSHFRTWQKIIHENITTALIMESDVDWDMRIKQSMVGVGAGTRAIADWPFDPEPTYLPDGTEVASVNQTQAEPYGHKWDLLWLGHCGSAANGDGRVYAFNDSAAPDEDHAWSYGSRPDEGHRPEGTRIVYHLRSSVCTTSYAITNQGARKFVELFKEANSPIDLKLWDSCANNPKYTCIGVWPQVISMTESRGNIKHTEGGLSFGKVITEEKVVAGKSIQVSSRVNAQMGTADKGADGWTWEWKPGEKTAERLRKDEEAAAAQDDDDD